MHKVCVSTGGSYGVGVAVSKHFSGLGYKVYNLDMRPSETGRFIKCDVSSPANINQAFELISTKEKRIDVLVVSAGVHFSGNVEATSIGDFKRVIGINVKGANLSVQASLPSMKYTRGSIALVSLDQAFVGKRNSFVYNLSKSGVSLIARTIAIDYSPYQFRCNAICLGTIDTSLYRNVLDRASMRLGKPLEFLHQEESSEQLLNRIATASEVAEFIAFLCSDNAGFITGSLHSIDGGYTTVLIY